MDREPETDPIIDLIPAMVWSATSDGMLDFANQHFLDFIGRRSRKSPERDSMGYSIPTTRRVSLPNGMRSWFLKMRGRLKAGSGARTATIVGARFAKSLGSIAKEMS